MNFTQVIEQDDTFVELKYCERCGGLWLRPLGSDESYCDGCRAALAAWPRVARTNLNHRGHRGTQGKAFHGQAVSENEAVIIETLLGIAEGPVQNERLNDLVEVAL